MCLDLVLAETLAVIRFQVFESTTKFCGTICDKSTHTQWLVHQSRHTRTHSHAHTHAHTPPTHKLSHTHTHTHAHTRAHTHTLMPYSDLFSALGGSEMWPDGGYTNDSNDAVLRSCLGLALSVQICMRHFILPMYICIHNTYVSWVLYIHKMIYQLNLPFVSLSVV